MKGWIVFNKKTNERIDKLKRQVYLLDRYIKELETDLTQVRVKGSISLAHEDKYARDLLQVHAELIQELWEDASMGDHEEAEVHE